MSIFDPQNKLKKTIFQLLYRFPAVFGDINPTCWCTLHHFNEAMFRSDQPTLSLTWGASQTRNSKAQRGILKRPWVWFRTLHSLVSHHNSCSSVLYLLVSCDIETCPRQFKILYRWLEKSVQLYSLSVGGAPFFVSPLHVVTWCGTTAEPKEFTPHTDEQLTHHTF